MHRTLPAYVMQNNAESRPDYAQHGDGSMPAIPPFVPLSHIDNGKSWVSPVTAQPLHQGLGQELTLALLGHELKARLQMVLCQHTFIGQLLSNASKKFLSQSW